MTAGKYDITVEQGTTYSKIITLTDESTDVLIDLTGYTAKLQVRKDVNSELLFEMSTTDGRIVIETPVNGEVKLLIPATDTINMVFEDSIYNLELYGDGEVVRLLEGRFIISKGVIR